MFIETNTEFIDARYGDLNPAGVPLVLHIHRL